MTPPRLDPFVTVVMPVRDEEDFIARSLGAVLAQDWAPARLEVLVVDGRSTDGTRRLVEEVAAAHPEHTVRVLDNPRRIAPCALNVGLAHARGDVVVRVDGHCEIAPDYVARAVARLHGDGENGGEGWDGVGGPLDTVGDGATARAIAVAMGHPFGVGGAAFRTAGEGTADREVDTIAFPAYTRDILERTGAFDEELVRNQDDEYNVRLRSRGGRLLLTGELRARYFSRGTFRKLWRQYFQYGLFKVRVLQKHPAGMQPRHFVPGIFVATLAAGAAASPAWPVARLGLAGVVVLYLLAVFAATVHAATVHAASRAHGDGDGVERWRVALAFAVLHLAYGTGFLAGLGRFAGRWGDRCGRVPDLVLGERAADGTRP